MTEGIWDLHIHRKFNQVVYAFPEELQEVTRRFVWSLRTTPIPEGSELVPGYTDVYQMILPEGVRIVFQPKDENNRKFVRVIKANLTLGM